METTAVPLSRNRDFVLLWSGQLVSTLGSQVSLVAFPLLVLALRVNSVARLLSGSMVPLGALSGGLLAATVGTTSTFLIFAGWQALVAAAALSARSLRHAVA